MPLPTPASPPPAYSEQDGAEYYLEILSSSVVDVPIHGGVNPAAVHEIFKVPHPRPPVHNQPVLSGTQVTYDQEGSCACADCLKVTFIGTICLALFFDPIHAVGLCCCFCEDEED